MISIWKILVKMESLNFFLEFASYHENKQKKGALARPHSAKMKNNDCLSLIFNNHIERTHFDKINIAHLLEINNDY